MFYVSRRKRHLTPFFPLIVGVAALWFLWTAAGQITTENTTQEKTILSNALSCSITQCYALEGFYPPDLDYLCEHYGFTYNTDHFFITYTYIGSNLRPDVTIIEKES